MKPKYERDQRTERFLMLFSVAEKKALVKAAYTANVSLGEFVRRAVAKAIEEARK